MVGEERLWSRICQTGKPDTRFKILVEKNSSSSKVSEKFVLKSLVRVPKFALVCRYPNNIDGWVGRSLESLVILKALEIGHFCRVVIYGWKM